VVVEVVRIRGAILFPQADQALQQEMPEVSVAVVVDPVVRGELQEVEGFAVHKADHKEEVEVGL
jgi:hypothetical protein